MTIGRNDAKAKANEEAMEEAMEDIEEAGIAKIQRSQ